MIVAAAGVGLTAVAGCAALGIDLGTGMLGAPDDATIAAGLKEALQVGAERSVSRAGRPGGFLDDPNVRIPLPPELEKLGRGLRALGFDGAFPRMWELYLAYCEAGFATRQLGVAQLALERGA